MCTQEAGLRPADVSREENAVLKGSGYFLAGLCGTTGVPTWKAVHLLPGLQAAAFLKSLSSSTGVWSA